MIGMPWFMVVRLEIAAARRAGLRWTRYRRLLCVEEAVLGPAKGAAPTEQRRLMTCSTPRCSRQAAFVSYFTGVEKARAARCEPCHRLAVQKHGGAG